MKSVHSGSTMVSRFCGACFHGNEAQQTEQSRVRVSSNIYTRGVDCWSTERWRFSYSVNIFYAIIESESDKMHNKLYRRLTAFEIYRKLPIWSCCILWQCSAVWQQERLDGRVKFTSYHVRNWNRYWDLSDYNADVTKVRSYLTKNGWKYVQKITKNMSKWRSSWS